MPAGNLVTTTETTTAEQKVTRKTRHKSKESVRQRNGYPLAGFASTDLFVSARRAAEILDIYPTRVRRWTDRGLLPVVVDKFGFRHYPLDKIQEIAHTGKLVCLPLVKANAELPAAIVRADQAAIAAATDAANRDDAPDAATDTATTQKYKQVRRTTTRVDPHALDGETAADLFDRFDRGEPLVRIVIDCKLPPETVARAHGEFHRLLGRVALDPDQVQTALSVLRHFGAVADAVPGTAPAPLGDQLVAAIAKLHGAAVKKDTAACEVCATLGRDEPKRAVRCLEHSKLPR